MDKYIIYININDKESIKQEFDNEDLALEFFRKAKKGFGELNVRIERG